MCGIIGSINVQLTQPVVDLLKSRGPDDSGLVHIDSANHDLWLGHRRLSIVDLSPAGHQPMVSDCGRYWLVFNGEVYNHQEIRKGLRQQNFQGHSDTETLLYALKEQGPSAVSTFNGIFGLAFADLNQQKLFLARDSYGVKPVYYSTQQNQLVFASEIKPILRLLPDEVDAESLAELLLLRYTPSPDTLFKGIKKLRTGHVLEIDLAKPSINSKEWSYLEPIPKQRNISFDDAVCRYGELFDAAVRRQLMADVEVGILLSGGVDSALVAASAKEEISKPMKAFTVGFTEQDAADEIDDAAETAQVLGLEHLVKRIGAEDFFKIMEECIDIVEEPLATTSVIPMHYLSGLAAEHVKVVMSGQGADEPLGGYGRYQGELLLPYLPAPVAHIARFMVGKLGIRNQTLERGVDAACIKDDLARFLQVYAVFDRQQIQGLMGISENRAHARVKYYYDLLECRNKSHSVERMMGLDMHLNMADDLLLYTDKITMHHSLECRVPILDHELVKFIESLPVEHRLRFREGKRVHKAFAQRSLPTKIVNRPKKGFWSPTSKWFRDKDFLSEMLLSGNSKFDTYFDNKAVAGVLDEHAQGYDRQRHIFLLLSIKHWLDIYA
jgi:asparagine synthase (glutamine-hydrolysing)